MKKLYLLITVLFIFLLLLTSCSFFDYPAVSCTYDGQTYTSLCEYGNIRTYYGYTSGELEDITVKSNKTEFKAQKLSGDKQTTFFSINDILYVKENFELPTPIKNKNLISHIGIDFFDEDIITISEKVDISEFAKVIYEADNKADFVDDAEYKYVANVEVHFNGSPLYFCAGELVADKNNNYFFSSNINDNNKDNKERRSYYSVFIGDSLQEKVANS